MNATSKTPPVFKENNDDYEQWKQDLDYWTFVTDVPKEKIPVTIHLNLTGRA